MFTLSPHCSLLECRILKGEAEFAYAVTVILITVVVFHIFAITTFSCSGQQKC